MAVELFYPSNNNNNKRGFIKDCVPFDFPIARYICIPIASTPMTMANVKFVYSKILFH